MNKRIVNVDSLPRLGPYSHAVVAEPFVFLSGLVPIDPATGAKIQDDVGAATALVLENAKLVLAAAGASLESVVKTTVFLTDMASFPAMNEVYARYFTSSHPARSTVAVKQLPADLPVEIEIVALVGAR